MQKKVIIGILVVMAVLLTIGLFPVHGEAKIYDSVVRLHVLANSDSDADQARKLKVRDAILTVTAPLLDDCPDRATAEALLREPRGRHPHRRAWGADCGRAGRRGNGSVRHRVLPRTHL